MESHFQTSSTERRLTQRNINVYLGNFAGKYNKEFGCLGICSHNFGQQIKAFEKVMLTR